MFIRNFFTVTHHFFCLTHWRRVFLGVVVFSIVSCGDNRDNCSGPGSLGGVVEKRLNITCFPFPEVGEYVIQNQIQLDELFAQSSNAGIACNFEPIDFEKHTLLGYYTSVKACNAKFDRDVERVETLRRYIFKINVVACTGCDETIFSYNWVLVPKLPPGWSVDFQRE